MQEVEKAKYIYWYRYEVGTFVSNLNESLCTSTEFPHQPYTLRKSCFLSMSQNNVGNSMAYMNT